MDTPQAPPRLKTIDDLTSLMRGSRGRCARCGEVRTHQLVLAIREGKTDREHTGPGRTVFSKTLMVCEPCAVEAVEHALSHPR